VNKKSAIRVNKRSLLGSQKKEEKCEVRYQIPRYDFLIWSLPARF
jgi:hypothetical protein